MSWLIYPVYGLSMFVCASLVFVIFTKTWCLDRGSVHYRGEDWDNEVDRWLRLLSTIAGAVFGFCIAAIFAVKEYLFELNGFVMRMTLFIGFVLLIIYAFTRVVYRVGLGFEWLNSLLTAQCARASKSGIGRSGC